MQASRGSCFAGNIYISARLQALTGSASPAPLAADDTGKLRVTLGFVQAMLAAFKDEQLIHRRYAMEIIMQARLRAGAPLALIQ